MGLQWLYSGSTVGLQWLMNKDNLPLSPSKGGTVATQRRTKDEQKTNNERRKSVGKLVLSRRILERVRQVSSIFYAFKLTFWALNIVSW